LQMTKPTTIHPLVWLLYGTGASAALFGSLYLTPKFNAGENVTASLIICSIVIASTFAAGLFMDMYDLLSARYPKTWERKSVRWLLMIVFASWTTFAAIRAYGDVNTMIKVNAPYAEFTLGILTVYHTFTPPLAILGHTLKYVASFALVSLVLYGWTPLWRPINAGLYSIGLIGNPQERLIFKSSASYLASCFRVMAFGAVAGAGFLGSTVQPGASEFADKVWGEIVLFADFSSSHQCKGIPKENRVLFTEPGRVVEAIRSSEGIKFRPRDCEYESEDRVVLTNPASGHG